MQQDTIQGFVFDSADIKGQLVHLTDCFETIITQHSYPEVIQKYLGEALLSAILLSANFKYEGRLTLQFKGNGAISLLLIKCCHELKVRALVQYNDQASIDEFESAFNEGQLSLTVEPDNKIKPYQSIVPMKNNSIPESLEYYFAQSEQTATKLKLVVKNKKASGMLLQLMPEQATSVREDFWEYAQTIGNTVTDDELIELDNITLLHRLYHEETLRLYKEKEITFHCPCNTDKMKRAVKLLGKDEAQEIIKEKNIIDVSCEFCNTHYQFDKVDIAFLFNDD